MKNQKPKKRLIRDVIIKPRTPKWERQFLEKKQAEEYFALHNSQRHPLVKKYHKAIHFLKWSIKLLVPDFLIGHPNLWDNLKTLRKHPQFHPLRMALAAWLIFSITFGSLGIYSLQQAVKLLAASPATDTFTDETKIASSTNITVDTVAGQVKLAESWSCGQPFTDPRDGNTYNTVLIGSQCWMAENINYGTMIAGANNQTDNGTAEKYCYGDTESSCTSDGGLYQWGEAMQYAASCNGTGAPPGDACASPVQGICPDGWHIPSHYEYTTLEREICDSDTCATDFPYDESTVGWRGTDEGTQLRAGGSSGWEGLLVGYRDTNGSFGRHGTHTYIWSSSLENGTSAWRRQLRSIYTTVYRSVEDGLFGFSVRCIKDSGADYTTYYTSGSWTSVNLLLGETVTSIDSFVYNLSALPANTTATIQFSQDSTNWYNSSGVLGGSNTMATGTNQTIDLSGLGWSGPNFYYKITFTSDGADTPVLDDISVYFTSNQPPNTPTNQSPANGATGQDLNVTLTGSAYSDSESDPHTDTQWQVDDDADFATPVWARTAGSAETSTQVATSTGTFANELAGKTELDHNTTYYWRVRYSDGQWSNWSASTTFTANLANAPTNTSPADGATLTTLTPLLEASAFSDDQSGHTHAASQWLIDDSSDFSSPVYDSGETASAETSRAVPGGTLANFTTYYWKVRYKDSSGFWSNYSTSTSFVIQISETAVEVRPVFGNTTVDQGDAVNIDVQVTNFTDGSPLNNATTTINIYGPSGTKIVDGATMTYVTGSNGIYRYSYTVPSTSGSYLYDVTATQGSKSGYGASNFEVRTLASDISSTKSTVESEQVAQTAERAAQATSRAEVSQIKKEVESGILDAPKTAKSGDAITIKYKTQSGLTGSGAPKLNIYDANNVQRVTDAPMTEIGSTGVYFATTTLQASWGTGFFTVIVSESTNNTADHTQIFVGASDIQSIGSDVSSIKSTVENTNANVDILVGAFIVTQGTVNDASASTTAFVSSLSNSTDDFYNNAVLTFTSGTLDGQSRRISDYDGTSKKITLDPPLTSAPANGDAFTIVMQNVRVEEQVTAHEAAQASFRSDTTSRLTDIGSKIDTLTANLNTVDANLDSVLSTVNSIRNSQQKNYKVELSDVSEVQAGNTYRAKLTILDYESNPVDASSTPTILIYDATRAVAQATTTMTKLSTGVYEYTYVVSPSATTGLWETIVDVDVGGTADIVRNDYWQVTGAPAQVVINSMSDLSVPSIAANVTITNEGGGAFEYQYEWCVVSSQTDQCGGDDDVYYASAAKLIAAGNSFNPTLTATVPNTGNYWFKVVVYFGTETSGASRAFTATTEEEAPTTGGGGGGGVSPTLIAQENIYSEIINTRQALESNAQKLAGTLEILGAITPAMQKLLSVNTLNTESLIDIQNKVADLKAVSSVTRRLIEQRTVEPIVETYMKFNSVEIHFLITNPDAKQQVVKFKAFLPKEVRPEHILDKSGLKVDYDANAAVYYVSGNITLGPKESVTRKVEIKDIWVFSPEEIKSIKDQAESLAKTLVKTQYEAQGTILKNDIDSSLNIILLRQEESYSSPQDHIVVYRENKERMTQAKNNLEKLKDLTVQAGASRGVVGQVGGIQTFATWGIILAIVFGFGLLATVVFAMWRHQTMLAAAAMGMSRKEISAHFGGVLPRSRRRKLAKRKPPTETRLRSVYKSLIRHLPWKKTLTLVVVLGAPAIIGIIVAVKFAPGLFSSKEMVFENKETPAVAPVAPQEKSIGSKLVPETQDNVKIFFSNDKDGEKDEAVSESTNPTLKITDTPTGWLNVRDDASLEGKIITKIHPGEEYEYTDKQNSWYKIILNDKTTGWIYEKYVQTIGD